MWKGKDFRLTLPLTPRPPSRPLTPLLSCEDTVLDYKIDTDSDESTVSVLSHSLKRKLPPKNEQARKNASPSPSSSEEETRESQLESTSRRKKSVSEWSVIEVKDWAVQSFGDGVGEKFADEEIDGAILLSQTVRTEEALEKLGLHTIGKKGKFLAKVDELSGDSPSSQKPKINTSQFRHLDRLLTREEQEYLSCKDTGIYNTKKKKITKEVEKRWPKKSGCVLPNYRIKADDEVVDEFVNKLAEDKAVLFPEFGLKKGAILEVVLKKFQEQRRQQKDTVSLVTHDDSTTETTESASESTSSSSSSPPASQLTRVKKYNLYFHEGMTQSSADLIIMVFLEKLSLKDVKMDHLHKLKKLFQLGLLRGKDKATHIRAIASALYSEGYISIPEESNLASLARSDVKVIKLRDVPVDSEDNNK